MQSPGAVPVCTLGKSGESLLLALVGLGCTGSFPCRLHLSLTHTHPGAYCSFLYFQYMAFRAPRCRCQVSLRSNSFLLGS